MTNLRFHRNASNLMNPQIHKFFLFFLTGVVFQIHGLLAQESYSIATYNIRYDNPGDTSNHQREEQDPHPINLIRFHEMDIIGTQEGLYSQVEDIQKGLEFPFIGPGNDTTESEGASCAVYYNPEKFKLLDKGTFWFSPVAESATQSPGEAANRVCAWGKFQSPEGNYFYVFNVHYKQIGPKARVESSKLLLKKIQEINRDHLPCIVTGDFTVEENNDVYQDLLEGRYPEKWINLLVSSEGSPISVSALVRNTSEKILPPLVSFY